MRKDNKKNEEELELTTSAKFENQNPELNTLEKTSLNQKQKEIIDWLEKVKFKKELIGGVNEQDVWKKIAELNEMYEAALKAERIRYDVLLEAEKKAQGSAYKTKKTKDLSDYE